LIFKTMHHPSQYHKKIPRNDSSARIEGTFKFPTKILT